MKYRSVKENHLYAKAYAKGKKFVGRNAVVYVMRDTHSALLCRQNPEKKKYNRVGLTVTKKLGGAVKRNRCKRILREAYRQCDRELALRQGYIIILVAREAALTAKTQHIASDLRTAFRKLDMAEKGDTVC